MCVELVWAQFCNPCKLVKVLPTVAEKNLIHLSM